MSAAGITGSTEGLPKQFVTSLRILFDILDEDRSGYVSLNDIEMRWHEEGVKGLPSGVIDSLRKVAPKTGKLNFETFVTGLKLSLLRNNPSGSNDGNFHPGKENKVLSKDRPVPLQQTNRKSMHPTSSHQPPSQSQNEPGSRSSSQSNRPHSSRQLSQPSNTATVRPNNVLQAQNIELRNQIYSREQLQQSSIRRHSKAEPSQYREQEVIFDGRSKPHYRKTSEDKFHRRKDEQFLPKQRPKSVELQRMREVNFAIRPTEIPPGRPERPPPYRKSPDHNDIVRPDRPPPYRKPLDMEMPPTVPPRSAQGRIMQELKQWQRDHGSEIQGKIHTTHSDSKLVEKNRGNDIYVNIDQIRQQAAIFKKASPTGGSQGTSVRRQNSRRHTLSSGVDYNMIRRMKQLEKEKDELLQGLEVVDRAREWYLKQIADLTEKQNYADKVSCSDVTLQANQDRMSFIRSRITEVNLNLRSLMETSDKGFPAHMNLAVGRSISSTENSMKWMKDQNKQLTKEVGEKGEKITQLEKEKASLIRDLFEARSRHKTSYDDTTFM